jgi:hypothetical protein
LTPNIECPEISDLVVLYRVLIEGDYENYVPHFVSQEVVELLLMKIRTAGKDRMVRMLFRADETGQLEEAAPHIYSW